MAQAREAELGGERLPDNQVMDALRRYAVAVSPTHKGDRWELARLKSIVHDPLADARLPSVTATYTGVSSETVRREMTLLQSVLGVSQAEMRMVAR
ncbi:MAG: hypothetical protein LBL59_09570 [Xanthomonadaceae bacterium]|nr:hypothetical protein [Xanthomonadaceae bacterium]